MIPFPFQSGGAGFAQQSVAGGGGGGSDPYWASVTSLLHFNGADASTTFTDEKGITWTRDTTVGEIEIDTAQSVFGGASGLFNGGHIHTPTAGTADFGTGDFTFEARLRTGSFSAIQDILNNRSAAGGSGVTFRINTSGQLQFFWGAGTNLVTASSAMSTNTWAAVRLTRVGTTVYMFLNGTLVGSVSVGSSDLTATASSITYLGVYGAFSNSSGIFTGHMDEARITKGVGRSTANYTVDTSEFPNS